jgi:hypothetical protein
MFKVTYAYPYITIPTIIIPWTISQLTFKSIIGFILNIIPYKRRGTHARQYKIHIHKEMPVASCREYVMCIWGSVVAGITKAKNIQMFSSTFVVLLKL